MTLDQWREKNHGVIVRIPAGTVTGFRWWYLEAGVWTTTPKPWTPDMPKEYRPITTDRDYFVEIRVDRGLLVDQAHKAIQNRSGQSKDGPLTLARIR